LTGSHSSALVCSSLLRLRCPYLLSHCHRERQREGQSFASVVSSRPPLFPFPSFPALTLPPSSLISAF
jgi:hypothetical protein